MTLLKFFFVKRFLQTLASGEKTYYHSLKFYELVFLISVNKNVCGNFFSLFCSFDINKIQKIIKRFAPICLGALLQRACAKFQRKINPALELLVSFIFLNKRPIFHKTISLCLELFSVFFIMALVQSNNRC